MYFCVLEALQNVQKYAQAQRRSWSSFAVAPGRCTFEVTDDGIGFDTATVKKGAGLTNMSDRVDALAGSVEVTSRAGGRHTDSGHVPVPAAVVAA